MEASRDVERFRDLVVQQADDLEAAHDKRLSIHGRARAMELELPPRPDIPHAGLRAGVDALAPVKIEAITTAVSGVRKWDRAAGTAARNVSPAEPSTRDTHLLMLAALCQQVNAWRLVEKRAARTRRALDLAERVFDAYQNKQKEDLTELLQRLSGRVAQIYSTLHPGE